MIRLYLWFCRVLFSARGPWVHVGTRPSLRPLDAMRAVRSKNSDATRRENNVSCLVRRFHGAVSVPFPIGLGFHTRTIGAYDASITQEHAHRRPLWHNFRCDRTESEDVVDHGAQSGSGSVFPPSA